MPHPRNIVMVALERASISELVATQTTCETASTAADLPVAGSLCIGDGIVNDRVLPTIAMRSMEMLMLWKLRH